MFEMKKKLPLPCNCEGLRGEMWIDKHINEETIDNYLRRDDSVYYDMRMLIDSAKYENIGGDSYLSGFIKGFEVLPYPFIANVIDLPEEVGVPYNGETLFEITENLEYIPKYEESMSLIEYFFPKDKNIFLICGGGGYAKLMKQLLINLGWDKNKIFNVGGYWFYNGKNNIIVKREYKSNIIYDFWKIPYHNIDFTTLHRINKQ